MTLQWLKQKKDDYTDKLNIKYEHQLLFRLIIKLVTRKEIVINIT